MYKKILLVDDEEGIRKVLGISLADRGFEVHSAGNGQEALKCFASIAAPIVLTDIKMPGMDGIELLKAIKQQRPETEVIMITGHGDIDVAIKSLKYEATDFITKPIDEDMLEVALKRALERIDLRNQLKAYTENLERLVEEKSRQLIQAERLAAMGETVAGMAHAIKNIAGGLRGGAFVVEKGLTLDNRQYLEQGWQMVRDNVERIQQLSLDLLNIAKPGELKFQDTDPNKPLRAVYDLIRPQAEQFGVRLNLHTDPDLPLVPLDAEGIHRSLLNLVTNAMDACLQCLEPAPTVHIDMRVTAVQGGIEYQVRDTCGGMDDAVKEKLFNGFFTTKGSRGTGIGLMLTRKLVEMHGGQVRVESVRGQGSAFYIRLPGKSAKGAGQI